MQRAGMTRPTPQDRANARQARLVAIVMIAAFVLWMGGQWLGPRLGLPVRYVFLFDLAALAAFLWAFIVTYQIWRRRRDNEG